MGHILLHFTGENVAAPCDNRGWKRAVIVEGKIDYDFGFELQPAYRVHGHWLTVDLTASVCGADHLFNGDLGDDGASGSTRQTVPPGESRPGCRRSRAVLSHAGRLVCGRPHAAAAERVGIEDR